MKFLEPFTHAYLFSWRASISGSPEQYQNSPFKALSCHFHEQQAKSNHQNLPNLPSSYLWPMMMYLRILSFGKQYCRSSHIKRGKIWQVVQIIAEELSSQYDAFHNPRVTICSTYALFIKTYCESILCDCNSTTVIRAELTLTL